MRWKSRLSGRRPTSARTARQLRPKGMSAAPRLSCRRLVVRNGHARPREVLTSAGAVEVMAPRVNDKRIDDAYG